MHHVRVHGHVRVHREVAMAQALGSYFPRMARGDGTSTRLHCHMPTFLIWHQHSAPLPHAYLPNVAPAFGSTACATLVCIHVLGTRPPPPAILGCSRSEGGVQAGTSGSKPLGVRRRRVSPSPRVCTGRHMWTKRCRERGGETRGRSGASVRCHVAHASASTFS